VSGSDDRSAGDQAEGYGGYADQASPGGIPPSFGASAPAPPPPAPGAALAASGPAPAAPRPAPAPAAPGPAPAPAAPAPAAPAPAASAPAPDPAPEPDDGSTVGWYPSGGSGQPTAGPFANPSTPARRRVPRLSLSWFARPAGSGGRTRSWGSGRGTLMNVLLFGAGPLALAGLIVAAFVLVAPGKGAASSLGFTAGPAPSTQQSAASAAASPSLSRSSSPSPSAHKKHPRATSTASLPAKVPHLTRQSPKPKATPKATPKPTHKAGGVTPHNLGLPNFAGYCQHIGHRTAEVVASNAYGWHCTLFPSQVLKVVSVCAWTYHLSTGQVIDVSTNYNDPNAWQCWRINRDLGVLNFAKYCAGAGLGTSKLVADNAYGWYCTSSSAPIDTTGACDALYQVSDAVSRFAVFADPYSWQCWN
jgi:hypothetical protein